MPIPSVPVVNKAATNPPQTDGATPVPKGDGATPVVRPPQTDGATTNRYYYDSTAGQIVNVDDYTTKYEFNLPLLQEADASSLPTSLYPGPTHVERGYLIQDPTISVSNNSITGAGVDADGNATSSQVEYVKLNQDSQKYGFRFMYNPPQVSMAVGYSPGVDPMTLMNNLDSMYNPVVPNAGSDIVFELLLNRVEDVSLGDSLSVDHYPKGSGATSAKIHDILRRGTMADFDYLLLALNFGKRLQSKYRGNTPDIGWLLGGAVVLKLGKSLVYQGYISSVSINHVRFSPTMVPTLSSVQVTMSRIVDFVPGQSEGSRKALTDSNGNEVASPWAASDYARGYS